MAHGFNNRLNCGNTYRWYGIIEWEVESKID